MTRTDERHSEASLALMPATPVEIPVRELASICIGLKLAGDPIDDESRYYVGERFLSQISFLGCSPHIELDGDASSRFTHIVLHALDAPRVFCGRHTRPPRCPACNRPAHGWEDSMTAEHIACPHCGERAALGEYDWRRTGGVTATLIEITEIYPREALPQTTLLDDLGKMTGCEWDYFYF